MSSIDDIYQDLSSQSRQSFEEDDFDKSYHLLAACFHIANAQLQSSWLNEISSVAQQRQELIDANAPEWEHSTTSARTRGNKGIFHTLSTMATMSSGIAVNKKQRLNG